MSDFTLTNLTLQPSRSGEPMWRVSFVLCCGDDPEDPVETIAATVHVDRDDTLPVGVVVSEALERVRKIADAEMQARKQPARPA